MLVLCNTPFVHAHVYLQYLNSALPGLQPIEADVVHLIIGGVQGGSIQAMEPWCLHMEKVFIPLHDFFFFFFWRRLSLLFTKKNKTKTKWGILIHHKASKLFGHIVDTTISKYKYGRWMSSEIVSSSCSLLWITKIQITSLKPQQRRKSYHNPRKVSLITLQRTTT